MLRRPTKGKFLAELFEAFEAKGNSFSTTIHVLVSATVKLARTIKMPSGAAGSASVTLVNFSTLMICALTGRR